MYCIQQILTSFWDTQEKYGKSISKDTWSLFLDFINSCDADFKEYDEDGAWPVVIDSFVEYARTALKKS